MMARMRMHFERSWLACWQPAISFLRRRCIMPWPSKRHHTESFWWELCRQHPIQDLSHLELLQLSRKIWRRLDTLLAVLCGLPREDAIALRSLILRKECDLLLDHC